MGCRCGAWPRFQDAVSVCTWSGGETPRSELVSVCRVRSSRSVRVSPPFVRLQSTSDREVPICHYIAVFLHIYAPPPYVSRAAAHKPARAHAHTQAKHTSPRPGRPAARPARPTQSEYDRRPGATRLDTRAPRARTHTGRHTHRMRNPCPRCSRTPLLLARRPPSDVHPKHTHNTHTHTQPRITHAHHLPDHYPWRCRPRHPHLFLQLTTGRALTQSVQRLARRRGVPN